MHTASACENGTARCEIACSPSSSTPMRRRTTTALNGNCGRQPGIARSRVGSAHAGAPICSPPFDPLLVRRHDADSMPTRRFVRSWTGKLSFSRVEQLHRNRCQTRMMHVTLTPLPSYPNEFVGSPLGTNRIGWHLILLRARRQPLDWIATVRVSCKKNTAGTQRIPVALTLVKQVFGVKLGILFLGDCNALFRVRLQNVSDTADSVDLTLLSIPSLIAAIGVYLQNPTAFRDGFQSARGCWTAQVRKGLSTAALKGQDFQNDYRLWTRYFDTWSEGRLQ